RTASRWWPLTCRFRPSATLRSTAAPFGGYRAPGSTDRLLGQGRTRPAEQLACWFWQECGNRMAGLRRIGRAERERRAKRRTKRLPLVRARRRARDAIKAGMRYGNNALRFP